MATVGLTGMPYPVPSFSALRDVSGYFSWDDLTLTVGQFYPLDGLNAVDWNLVVVDRIYTH